MNVLYNKKTTFEILRKYMTGLSDDIKSTKMTYYVDILKQMLLRLICIGQKNN